MKDISRHGISIGIERVNADYFLYIKATGRLTHADYALITPLIDYVLQGVEDPQVKVLVDAREFEGWELRAAWDDFKLGLKHGKEFSRIALFGNKHWQEVASRIANWFVSGEVHYFEECDEALEWLTQPSAEKPAKPSDSDPAKPNDNENDVGLWKYPAFPPYL